MGFDAKQPYFIVSENCPIDLIKLFATNLDIFVEIKNGKEVI